MRGHRRALWLALLGLCGCGTVRNPATQPTQAGVRAGTEQVQSSPVTIPIEFPGVIRPVRSVDIGSEVPGTVIRVAVVEGQSVREGEVLLEVDDRESRSEMARADAEHVESRESLDETARAIDAALAGRTAAEAEAALADRTLERYRPLLERGAVSRQEFDLVDTRRRASMAEVGRLTAEVERLEARRRQMAARIEQTQAGAETARIRSGLRKISAPFAGVIVSKTIETGGVVSPGTAVVTLESHQVRAEFLVEESRIAGFRPGLKITVEVGAVGQAGVEATVTEIVPSAEPGSRSFVVRADLPSMPGIRSGMFARGRLTAGGGDSITIPPSAVLRRGALTAVFVIDNEGKARMRWITTGHESGGRTSVLTGLNAGDRIVSQPPEDLRDGTPVIP